MDTPPLHDGTTLPHYGEGRRIKGTRSLCPHCLESIDAEVFERDGGVWMDKHCPEHGRFCALLSSDAAHYYIADPAVQALGSCCGPSRHCGDAVANHSCNMLIEITSRCNLTCPTCYADSSPTRTDQMTLERFDVLLDDLLAKGKGDADLIQLSGGEPTIHPQMFEMLDLALRKGFQRVYINTNGIRLARPAFAERLASYGKAVSVYLQLDGLRPRTLRVLRGREDLVGAKLEALDQCERLGIDCVPVVTLTPGVNDDELGTLLRLAADRPRSVRKVMIQPAMYSGRYDNPRLVHRMTVADVAKAVAAQTDGLFTEADFSPIPCSDPNCFSMALALRAGQGLDALVPVSRYFPRYARWAEPAVQDVIGRVTDTFDDPSALREVIDWVMRGEALTGLDDAQMDALLDRIVALQASAPAEDAGPWQGLFAIGIKPFMDAYTYDQDRIDKCCVHIIASDGQPVSFCEYNARHRPLGRG
ncbi:MAG: radical SAM protein [Deltaproteobacteria bacterium]|nr:radical SAM protein [Deltaproteobacteria bacterium]